LTLEEIGSLLGITRERVRQIKEKALVRLRHASRSRFLETFLACNTGAGSEAEAEKPAVILPLTCLCLCPGFSFAGLDTPEESISFEAAPPKRATVFHVTSSDENVYASKSEISAAGGWWMRMTKSRPAGQRDR